MSKKCITSTAIAIFVAGTGISAQTVLPAPKLVVNIAIDQLRTDYLEQLEPLYGNYGFKRLLRDGLFCTNAVYPFSPVDCASALAAINTATTPNYNGITAEKWYSRTTGNVASCVDDPNFKGVQTKDNSSAENILTTTLSDELKVSTYGLAQIYSIAESREAAIIPAGHNANGTFWASASANSWCTSTYYSKDLPKWLDTYNKSNKPYSKSISLNEQITELALKCISANSLGKDDITDILFLTYDASSPVGKDGKDEYKETYIKIDNSLERLFTSLQTSVGLDNILFVVTGTGYVEQQNAKPKNLRIPGGTFYINRSANLLNMYLGALYGSDKYIEDTYNNQIFFNEKTLDKKRLNKTEVAEIAKQFLRESQGVANAFSASELMSAYTPEMEKKRRGYRYSSCGDIMIEVSPGWNIVNEDTHQQFKQNNYFIQTPIIFYGKSIKGKKLTTPVSILSVSPTIAKTINIRAPNACSEEALF